MLDPREGVQSPLVRYTLIYEGTEIPLHHEETVIGRASGCQLVLDHVSVSRRHARLTLTDPVSVHDLDSPNGVYVNGKRIVSSQAIRSGDVITVGHQELHFVAVGDEATPPSPPSRDEGDEEDDALVGDDLTMVNDVTALLCTAARRMLEAGDVEKAEEALKTRWQNLTSRGHSLHPALAIFAARTGLRMAAATHHRFWADDAAIMLAAADVAPDTETLTEIESAADAVGMTSALRAYLTTAVRERAVMDPAAQAQVTALLARK